MPYDASNTRQVRAAARKAKIADDETRLVIINLMSSPAGRSWMHSRLAYCHIFHTTFTGAALSSAFGEGQRDVGLQLLLDVMRYAPDQYVFMMHEQNDKELADGRRTDDSESRGRSANGGRDPGGSDDANGTVVSDYEPGGIDDPNAEDYR